MGEQSYFDIVGTELFLYRGQDAHVVIPEGVTVIVGSAFTFTEIESISIPNSVEIIEDQAFGFCKCLTSVTIPDSVTIIGEDHHLH